jgi:hypothetical protein
VTKYCTLQPGIGVSIVASKSWCFVRVAARRDCHRLMRWEQSGGSGSRKAISPETLCSGKLDSNPCSCCRAAPKLSGGPSPISMYGHGMAHQAVGGSRRPRDR